VDGALVTQAVHDPNLDRVLMGQFELREIAGRGAMGTVYRAYQRTMDRIVAVKILRSEIVKEPGVLRRFLREARAAARLQHPNIVTVHMVGETEDGVPYLVMEHIDGVSLEAICEAQGPQPLGRVISFGRQIAAALSEAHSLGIVHRDLKPANILITDRSRTPDLVKVLDFGIAKLINTEADQSMMTADGTIFGTPHYIAPEQASGGDLDHRADIYSLGCILFRLATGVLPFEGTQSMQVVLKHLREEPPRPRSIDASIPQGLEDLILACLQKSRSRRPDDAEQVIASLDRIEAEARTPKSQRMAPVHVTRPSPPNAASSPAWTVATPSPTPPGGQRASGPITSTSGHSKLSSTGKIAAMRGQSPWANRAVWIGVFVAATIGASVGVLAALTHNSAEDSVPPAPDHPAMARMAAPTSTPLPGATPIATTAGTTAVVTAPGVRSTPSVAPAVTPIATSIVPAPAKTVARVESPNPVRRRPRQHDGDDLPMTVVPPDPPQQKIVAHSLPPTSSAPKVISQPVVTNSPPVVTRAAPSAPPPATTTPAPSTTTRDEEPPPAPPPPVNDPTTLPPPAAN
jgi:serine/threonine protein kinase